jgi:quercetin dioxygenase-like cupin family protein
MGFANWPDWYAEYIVQGAGREGAAVMSGDHGHRHATARSTSGVEPRRLAMSKSSLLRPWRSVFAAAVAVILETGLAAPAALAQQAGINRIDLQRHDLSAPGREAVQVRVDFNPGAVFGRHTHPGEEIIYVLEGSLEYEVEGKPTVTLHAGDVLFIPAGTIHAAKNVGNGTAKELATYVLEKGKPPLTLVK